MGFAMNVVCQSIFRPGDFDLVVVRQAMQRVFDHTGLDQSFPLQLWLDAPFDGFMIRRIHEISVAHNSALSEGLRDWTADVGPSFTRPARESCARCQPGLDSTLKSGSSP